MSVIIIIMAMVDVNGSCQLSADSQPKSLIIIAAAQLHSYLSFLSAYSKSTLDDAD